MNLLRLTTKRAQLGSLAIAGLLVAACGADTTSERAPVTAPPSGVEESADQSETAEALDPAAVFASVFQSAETLSGEQFDGAQLADQPSVLWFWAPWCTICRAEGPKIAEIAATYGDQVRIVGVPGRSDVGDMQRFVDDTGTTELDHVADVNGDIWSAFGVFGQPAFAFIAADGTIDVFVGSLGSNGLTERVDALIAT